MSWVILFVFPLIMLAMWVECSPMARDSRVQSLVESYQRLKKWYLMPPYLTLSIIRYVSRVKWSNSGKGVAPSPTLQCCCYLKGSLRVTLDYGRPASFIYISGRRDHVLLGMPYIFRGEIFFII